ncbi:hypothetical protein GOP47_0012857 [Adiantum capillus-veneris]|nr:hypothetical protein GOP47_0012857 [Adiantum capillus-veneris]
MSCGDKDKPGTPWDYALLAAVAAASVPFIAANAVIFLHRKRIYFRAQGGAHLIVTSSAAGLIWIVATFIINFHFPRNHDFLLICPLWSFWLQCTFGFSLWLACQIVRLLHLYRLCQSENAASSLSSSKGWTLLCGLVLWIPGLVFAIIATALRGSSSSNEGTYCANCELQGAWKYCTYIILPCIYFVILVTFLYHARTIKDHVMAIEYSHTCEYSFTITAVIYLLFVFTVYTKSQQKLPGRCFLTFCICFLVFVNFWVRLGWPVFLCLFKRESEMDNFEEELRSCGAECLDNLSSEAHTFQARGRTSSSLQYNDWLLRAIGAATSEALECKERISQLQQRRLLLSAKLQQREGSPAPQFMLSPASARRML